MEDEELEKVVVRMRWKTVVSPFLLIAMVAIAAQAAMAADEGRLVFELGQNANMSPTSIAISNANGSNLRIVAQIGENPLWFPDGDRIAFYVPEIPFPYRNEPDVPGITFIADLKGNVLGKVPYWILDISPDGNSLLALKPGGKVKSTYELGIYNLMAESYTTILRPEDFPTGLGLLTPATAKWHPDGKNVIFQIHADYRVTSSYLGELSVVDRKLKLRKVPRGIRMVPSLFFRSFDISPDGKTIVFVGNPPDLGQGDKSAIYTWNLESDTLTPIHYESGFAKEFSPVWSSDGKQIMFSYSISDEFNEELSLKVMNSDGSNLHRVFPSNVFHHIWNALGGAVTEWKECADWWQPKGRTGDIHIPAIQASPL